MTSVLPITLRGDNLGERHRHLNSLIEEAHRNSALETILDVPETSPVDVIFKIDLASKHRNVEFIIKTLKSDNMLYVSRALKCTWLLETKYQDIINPDHLESELYPNMITTAVNKMKHWVIINLRDPHRCEQFYNYYKNDLNTSIKYLCHCPPEFISLEFLNVMNQVTPKQLKVLCEYCPNVLKLYYEHLDKSPNALQCYIRDPRRYFDCSKYVLKSDPDTYFAVLEKYYDHVRFGSLPSAITERIMKKHKERFDSKPELYAAWILEKSTLAKCLSSDDNKELVLKLARAEYLGNWLSYKNVEPFIKRINSEERSAFKKKVFVTKDIGEVMKDWPYPIPSPPKMENSETVFDDIQHQPEYYKVYEQRMFKRCIKKRKGGFEPIPPMCAAMDCVIAPRKTLLDELFDRYRFFSFERTMFELRKQLAAEGSVKNREFMMLVLVSKCGENMDQIEKLLRFVVERHNNEPSNLRATIMRSLVVRACVWRLNTDAWNLLLEFGRDLGLDGSQPLICREGLHAALLRVLISGEECPDVLSAAFLDNFTTFTDYKLNAPEKRVVKVRLPALLIASATSATEPSEAQDRVQVLLDALSGLNLNAKDCPGAVDVIVASIRRDPSSAEYLLPRVYNMRIARRELFRENFASFQTNESYINALRHDSTVLNSTEAFEESLKSHSFNFDGFLKKLSLYFGEEKGLAALYVEAASNVASSEPHVSLARPLAFLHVDVASLIDEYQKETKGNPKRQMAAALQSNYHLARSLDVDTRDWQQIGAKAIANKILVCRAVDVEKYIQKSLEWRKTLKLALTLAERSKNLVEIYEKVRAKRPAAAVKKALSYFRRNKSDKVNSAVWRGVSPALAIIDLSVEQRRQLQKSLENANYIPSDIQAKYWTDIFIAFQRISKNKTFPILCRLENILWEVDPDVIRKVIEDFLTEFTPEFVSEDNFQYKMPYCMRSRVVAKYLLLGKNETEQKERLEGVWEPFLDRLTSALKNNIESVEQYLDEFTNALKYHKVFFNETISCLPVLERIATDLRKSLPMEGFFKTFVVIHATMLYYKSISRCLKENPENFTNTKVKRNEGATAVGYIFGAYVGKEIQELKSKYFDSVTFLYQNKLMKIINDQFHHNANKKKFVSAFVKGLIEAGNTEALLIAQNILHREHAEHDDDPERKELMKRLKGSDDKIMKFFLYADMYSNFTEISLFHPLLPPPMLR
ncbi:uncharacterized protein [Battus philenor]|uniref:uncharacterized protein n=1 Tax=Battus philenor TaxID=42288 RepID=UPI0035D03F1C